MAIATTVTAAIIGYAFLDGGSHKANIATVIQTAYDFGGREMHLQLSRQVPRRATRAVPAQKVIATTARQMYREGNSVK